MGGFLGMASGRSVVAGLETRSQNQRRYLIRGVGGAAHAGEFSALLHLPRNTVACRSSASGEALSSSSTIYHRAASPLSYAMLAIADRLARALIALPVRA